jgi:hypothetical protein
VAGPLDEFRRLEAAAAPVPVHVQIARGIARFRIFYVPLAVFALVAVGVHAAADTLDDRILWVVDHLDAVFDGLVGRFELTSGWVHWIDLADRVWIARACAFLWELGADFLLAVPVFSFSMGPLPSTRKLREQLSDLVRRPTVLRLTRPICALAVTLAGACAVGRMIQGSLYLGSRGLFGDSFASLLARAAALVAVVAVCATFGHRAVIGHLRRADALAIEEAKRLIVGKSRGLVGAAVLIPLAIAALLDATPLLSFFR